MIRNIFIFSLFIFTSCTWNEIPEIICVPDKAVYTESVQPIIEEKCVYCHSTPNNNSAFLVTYDGVIEAVNIYSLRYEVVSLHMPLEGSPPLSELEINIIKNWIDCE